MANTLQFPNLLITIDSFLNNKFVAFAITISQKFSVANWIVTVLNWSLEYGQQPRGIHWPRTAQEISLTEMLVSFPPVLEFLGTFLTPPSSTLLTVLGHNLYTKHITCDCGQGSDHSIWGWISSFPPSAISWDCDVKFSIILWLIKGFHLFYSICHTLLTDSLCSTPYNSNRVPVRMFIHWRRHVHDTSKFWKCLMANTIVFGSQNYPPVNFECLAPFDFWGRVKFFIELALLVLALQY